MSPQNINTEEFIREARIVMLSFYVDNDQIKQKATELIERKATLIQKQLGSSLVSAHVARNQALDSYYEMGSRYFKRYAAKNWRIFLKDVAKNRFDSMLAESAVIDEVIHQLQVQIRQTKDLNLISELGRYLMMKVRLEKAIDMIESAMLHMIETDMFKEKLLANVVQYFYRSYQATQAQNEPAPQSALNSSRIPLKPVLKHGRVDESIMSTKPSEAPLPNDTEAFTGSVPTTQSQRPKRPFIFIRR